MQRDASNATADEELLQPAVTSKLPDDSDDEHESSSTVPSTPIPSSKAPPSSGVTGDAASASPSPLTPSPVDDDVAGGVERQPFPVYSSSTPVPLSTVPQMSSRPASAPSLAPPSAMVTTERMDNFSLYEVDRSMPSVISFHICLFIC